MLKNRSTKRALLVSGLALVMCISMLIGSTFAWFTDSVTSGSNIIKSGNLDVALLDEDGNSLEGQMLKWDAFDKRAQDEILWEPGCTYNTQPFTIKNVGSLALKFQVAVNGIIGDAKLLEVIDFKCIAKNVTYTINYGGFDIITTGDVDFLDPAFANLDLTLEPGQEMTGIVLSGHMDEDAGNEYQDKTIEGISISVIATQVTFEHDSFDAAYDENATYPALVSNAAELKDALTNADVHDIVFVNDVTLDEAVKVTTDKVINFNGNDFTAKSGSRPFQVYGADITINATGSNVALDKYGLIDIREGADVKISIIGGTFNGELDNGAVIKGRASTKAEIYLKDVNMSFTDSSTKGSYVYNPVIDGKKSASADTIIDGGVYNIDCGFIGDVTMKNATVNAKGFIFNGGGSIENSTLTTDGSSKAPFDSAPFCCVAASNGRTVTVKNSTLTATNCNAIEVYPTGGTVTVVGSTVNGTCYKHAADANHQGAVISITIDGVEQ